MKKAILFGIVSLLLVSIAYSFPDTTNLVDYISFNDNSNVSDILSIQLVNHGTVNTTGVRGSGKVQDADGDRMVYWNSSASNYSQGTFCMWVYPSVTNDNDYFFALQDSTAETHHAGYGGGVGFSIRHRYRGINHDFVGAAPALNQWSFYCVRWDDTSVDMLQDAKEIISSTDWDPMNFELMNLFLGSYGTGALSLRGRYDEISIWNRNLTNAEIENMNSSFYSPPSFDVSIKHPSNGNIYDTTSIDLNWSYRSGPPDTCYYAIDNETNQTGLCSGGVATNITLTLAEGRHNITIWANNTAGLSDTKTVTDVIIDLTNPSITTVTFDDQYMSSKDCHFINPNNLTGQWLLSDTNLFEYNLRIDGQLISNDTDITSNQYYVNLSIDTDTLLTDQDVGLHYINITAWDGHTDKYIEGWEYKKQDQTIKFEFGDEWLSITPLDIKTDGTFDTYKETDRYSFTYDRKDNTKSDERFLYKSSRPITEVSRKRSSYPGWLIIKDLELWVDTATASHYDDTKIKRIDKYTVEVTLKGISDDVITLNSVGRLNKNNETFVFYIYNATEYHDGLVMELQNQTANVNVSIGTDAYDINMSFDYNGTGYKVMKSSGPESFNFEVNFLADSITTSIRNDTYFLNWYANFTGTFRTNETTNQSVFNLLLDNCTVTEVGTLNLTVLNYTSGLQVPATIEYTLTYWLPGSFNYALNYSNTEIQNETLCIYPDFVEAKTNALFTWTYDGIVYEYSTYNLSLTNISQSLDLYVTDGTTQVLFNVITQDDAPVVGAYIHVLAYDVGSGSYITTQILETDSQGQVIGNVVLGTTYYNFLIYYQGDLVLEETGVKLYTTTRTFVISLAGVDWWDISEDSGDVPTNLIYNNATRNFVYTWTDGTGGTNYGCLRVDVSNSSGRFNLVDNCSASASGTRVYHITPYNGTTFDATGYLKNDGIKYITDTLSVHFESDFSLFYIAPQLALFLAFLWILTLFFVGLPHPFIALPLFGLGIITSAMLGLWGISIAQVGGLLFLIVLKLYLAK